MERLDGDDESGRADGDDPAPVPVDLFAVATLIILTAVAGATRVASVTPVRHVLAVLAVFLPGYALVAALFPRGPLDPDEPPGRPAERVRRLDGFERFVLSMAAGLLVTPLVGIAVDFSPLGFRRVPVVAGVGGFVLVAAAVAARRRRGVPTAERYAPHRRWVHALERVRAGRPDAAATAVAVAVAVAVFVAAAGVFAVVGTAGTGERFTEFAVLTETDGDLLVAGSYPETVAAGEEATVVVTVENREYRRQTYTVVPRLQRVAERRGETRVVEHEEFAPVQIRVGDGRTQRRDLSVRPTMTGENLRLSFLLYRGDPPETVTSTTAYRRTHIWLNVTGPASE
ncbi:MAG: DUF1616 domain-containing protein [Haloarculaceae archaeon]